MFGLKRSLRWVVSKVNATQLTNISHVVGAAHPSYNDVVRAVAVYIRPCALVFWPGSAIDFGTPGCSIKVFWQDYKVSIVHIPPSHLKLVDQMLVDQLVDDQLSMDRPWLAVFGVRCSDVRCSMLCSERNMICFVRVRL